MPGGRWECPGLAATGASVKQGMSCMLFCDDTFAGSKTCSYEGWQDTPAPGNAGVDCGCHMSESCLWQTCRYGNSSQEWSVNCGLEDTGCLAAVAGAGLDAECDEFTGAGDCLLGCEVDILLLLLYYQYILIYNTPGLLQHRVPPVRGLLAHVPQHARSLQHRHVSRQAQGGGRLRAAVL